MINMMRTGTPNLNLKYQTLKEGPQRTPLAVR